MYVKVTIRGREMEVVMSVLAGHTSQEEQRCDVSDEAMVFVLQTSGQTESYPSTVTYAMH